MSALPPKADIAEGQLDVHFVPKADIRPAIRSSRQRWRTLGHGLDQARRPSRPAAGPRDFEPAWRVPFASPLFVSRNCNNADTLASRRLAMTPCDGSPPGKPHVPMSAFTPMPDIDQRTFDVRKAPKADMAPLAAVTLDSVFHLIYRRKLSVVPFIIGRL
jgi:hypothetical protein